MGDSFALMCWNRWTDGWDDRSEQDVLESWIEDAFFCKPKVEMS